MRARVLARIALSGARHVGAAATLWPGRESPPGEVRGDRPS